MNIEKIIKNLKKKRKTHQIENFFDVVALTKHNTGLFFEPKDMDYSVANIDLKIEFKI